MQFYTDSGVNDLSNKQLHNEADEAEKAVLSFMRKKPDLADPAVHAAYLPLKIRLDNALTALGCAK